MKGKRGKADNVERRGKPIMFLLSAKRSTLNAF